MIVLAILMKEFEMVRKRIVGKVWITTILHDLSFTWFYEIFEIQHVHGSLFLIQTMTKYDSFDLYLSAINQTGEESFCCLYSKHKLSLKGWTRCKEREEMETSSQEVLERILSQDSYRIYNIIQSLAHALSAAYTSRSNLMMKVDKNQPGHQRLHSSQVFISPHISIDNYNGLFNSGSRLRLVL